MRSAVMTGLLGGLLFAAAVFLLTEYAVPAALPITNETLEVASIDLGELRVNEQREFFVTLRNKSFRSVTLAPPDTNCGCLSLERKTIVIEGRECAEIPFSLRVPGNPSSLLRKITFRLMSDPTLVWEVPVRADITAAIWAVPSTLDFTFDNTMDILKSLVTCRHVPEIEIGRVVSSSPAIHIESKRVEVDRYEFEVNLNLSHAESADERRSAIRIHESKTDSVLLEIPVYWARRPILTCAPSVLVLDDLDSSKVHSEKQIILLSRVDASPAALTSTPRFSWIHVKGVERKTFGFLVRISFDTRAIPDKIEEPIIQFQLTEKDSTVSVVGRRGG